MFALLFSSIEIMLMRNTENNFAFASDICAVLAITKDGNLHQNKNTTHRYVEINTRLEKYKKPILQSNFSQYFKKIQKFPSIQIHLRTSQQDNQERVEYKVRAIIEIMTLLPSNCH